MKDAMTYAHEAGFFSFNVVGWKAEFERLIEAVRADAVADQFRDATKMVAEPVKRPQNCGTGYCSCIECVMEPVKQEPVGVYYGFTESMGHRVRLDVDLPTGAKLYAEPVALMKRQFPTHLRKMWSGTEVQQWLDEQTEPVKQDTVIPAFLRRPGSFGHE